MTQPLHSEPPAQTVQVAKLPRRAEVPLLISARAPSDTASVRSTFGRAYKRTVTSVMTPSVPHEPVRRRDRSKPATFFTTFPPARTISPRPFTNSRPSSRSLGNPKLVASGPAEAVAIVAPIVPSLEPNGSSGSHWSCSPVIRSISASVVPARIVSVRSPGT